ncbi:MAG: HAMP domain-containing histidine kinase [Alphaproteobacteria bacterium]|nr:HAMP domain-containing histidine kinase [Alphaproteobacteria bacterium]
MTADAIAEPARAAADAAKPAVGRGFFRSLAGRLLALTMAFVLIAEVLIFIPSLAGFYITWLRDRVDTAQIAALAVEASPSGLHDSLEHELLANAEVKRVTLLRDETRLLELARGKAPLPEPTHDIDLRTMTMGAAIGGALDALFADDDMIFRVTATPRLGSGERIQILFADAPLKRDLRRYARDVIIVSLALSLLTASFVYAALVIAVVRPIRGLTLRIERFRANPQASTPPDVEAGRVDEIGRAQTALAAMEQQVRASLRQRERLAALGGAVARIAHDLRAGLATAQLLTERLAASADPSVRQIAPRLEKAIERSGKLAQAALRYGKADETPPALEPLDVVATLREAAEDALAPFPSIEWRAPEGPPVVALADHEQMHRVFANLLRNAAQALLAQTDRAAPGSIAATVSAVGPYVLVRIVDDGPGVPEKVRTTLFEPFSSTKRNEGAGLGLAIARELAQAQGGDVALVQTGPEGTAFEVRLNAAPAA